MGQFTFWVPSPSPRTPTSWGRAEPWGGLNTISCSVLAPSSPSVTSQTPRNIASPKHPCSGPENPQVARVSHRGVKDPGEGKEERAAAQPRKKFREPPLTQLPRPAQQVHSGTHHWESR